jgi:hypothetical protein
MNKMQMHMLFLVSCLVTIGVPVISGAGEKLRDIPVVWYENDQNDIEEPKEREPSIVWDYFDDSWGWPRERWTDPNRLIRNFGTLFGGDQVMAAANINALDEVPNSTWFTNRIGLFPMSTADAARGPGDGRGPDHSAQWTVVSAKTEGVTPGFNIRDARGDIYLIKFDPKGYLNATTAAGVISGRILHAAGYNVPEDAAVTFRREDIVVGEGAKIKGPDGTKRPMTEADIDEILSTVDKLNHNEWLAISSKFLSGKPVGPFDYRSRRDDDPNDTVDHEHRRELRGFYVFAAFLNHYDTKQHNSLDMYVTEDGRRFVRHHFIDFASTLGAGASGLNPRYGYEFGFDLVNITRRAVTLGLVEDDWRKHTLDHGFTEVGYFDSKSFDPGDFKPLQPNHAFANTTKRDGYWAAKIVAAFRDEHIEAIVAEGGYREPGAGDYVTRILRERRDKIARYYFDRVTPLDFFCARENKLEFVDLGVKYTVYPGGGTKYRVRLSAVDENRSVLEDSKNGWIEIDSTSLPLSSGDVVQVLAGIDTGHAFLAIECQLNRGGGWSSPVTAYYSPHSGRIIAVDR